MGLLLYVPGLGTKLVTIGLLWVYSLPSYIKPASSGYDPVTQQAPPPTTASDGSPGDPSPWVGAQPLDGCAQHGEEVCEE